MSTGSSFRCPESWGSCRISKTTRKTLDISFFRLTREFCLFSRKRHSESLKLLHLKEKSLFLLPREGLGADFGDLKKFRTGVSKITENLSFGRLFRMAALRRRCDLRRRNGKPNPPFALQLRCITGHFSLVFSLYFPLFYPVYFSSAASAARN